MPRILFAMKHPELSVKLTTSPGFRKHCIEVDTRYYFKKVLLFAEYETYKQFVFILNEYSSDPSKPVANAYILLRDLFSATPNLLDDLQDFLPYMLEDKSIIEEAQSGLLNSCADIESDGCPDPVASLRDQLSDMIAEDETFVG